MDRCPAPLGPLEVQGALNETDPVLVASRKRRSAGTGLRGDGPGGGLAPASSHLDGGSRSETSAARAVRDRSGARTPAVTASRTRSTVPVRGQTSGSNLVAGSSCCTSSRRTASGCLPRTDRPITPCTDQCSSATAGKGRCSKEDHREKFARAMFRNFCSRDRWRRDGLRK